MELAAAKSLIHVAEAWQWIAGNLLKLVPVGRLEAAEVSIGVLGERQAKPTRSVPRIVRETS
jgi:hypothetical protein